MRYLGSSYFLHNYCLGENAVVVLTAFSLSPRGAGLIPAHVDGDAA
jgi:hypothetical protein